MAEIRASTVRQRREEVHATLRCAISFLNLVEERKDCEELKPKPERKIDFRGTRKKRKQSEWCATANKYQVNKKGEAKTHRMEWCAAANQHHCMRCGRSSNKINIPGTCDGPRWLDSDSNHKLKRWRNKHLGGHDMERRVDRHGEAVVWCRKCSGYGRCRLGPKLMNPCKPDKLDTKEHKKHVEHNLELEEGGVPDNRERVNKLKERKCHGKACNIFEGRICEVVGFMALCLKKRRLDQRI